MTSPPGGVPGLLNGFSRLAVSLTVVAAFLPACRGGATVQGIALVGKGRLTTCTHLPYAPFEFRHDGSVVGFDIDMIDLVAGRLGVRQKVVNIPFHEIVSGAALAQRRCDLAAGVTIDASRANAVDFSDPYLAVSQVLMARRGVHVSSLSAARRAKMRLGATKDSTGERLLREHGITPKAYQSSATELDALRTGQVDAIVADEPVVRFWLRDSANAGFAVAADLRTRERYAFAVRKGRAAGLLRLVDRTIDRARRNGAYARIRRRWLGPAPTGGRE